MKTSGFRISFQYRFEAAHRFTKSCADSCATPHGHTWHAKAIFKATDEALGGDDMVVEFSDLKRSWKCFVQGTVDHSFMHHMDDPILPALRSAIPKFRGLPFPGDPTTELISALFFAKLEAMHKVTAAANVLQPVSVLIRETPTNSVTFRRGQQIALLNRLNEKFEGWWTSADPEARHLKRR